MCCSLLLFLKCSRMSCDCHPVTLYVCHFICVSLSKSLAHMVLLLSAVTSSFPSLTTVYWCVSVHHQFYGSWDAKYVLPWGIMCVLPSVSSGYMCYTWLQSPVADPLCTNTPQHKLGSCVILACQFMTPVLPSSPWGHICVPVSCPMEVILLKCLSVNLWHQLRDVLLASCMCYHITPCVTVFLSWHCGYWLTGFAL